MVNMLLVGCGAADGSSAAVEKEIALDEVFIFVHDAIGSTTGDLYFMDGNEERIKIDSEVLDSAFQITPREKKILYVTEDNTLYLKELDKEKEKISSDVYPFSVRFSGDENTIAFEKKNSDSYDLYTKKIGEDKEKISSDNLSFELSWDGNTVFYVNSENNLYIKRNSKDKEKIASDVTFMQPYGDGEIVLYTNTDNTFYYKNILEDDKVKLSSESVELYYNLYVTDDAKLITYIDEYDYLKSRGELYSYKVGEDSDRLASDVSNHYLSNNGKYVYYINDEEELYVIDLKKDEKEKLATDVVNIIVSYDGATIAYLDVDDNLYLKEINKEKEKLATDVLKWDMTSEKTVILNNDKELYIKRHNEEKEKLATDIEDFSLVSNGTCLFYYNDNDELFSNVENQEPKMIIDTLKKTEKIYIQGEQFLQKKLSFEDISGIWKNDYFDEVQTITDDGELSINTLEYGLLTDQLTDADFSNNSISAYFYDEEYNISMVDKDTININYSDYYKITEQEYEEWKDDLLLNYFLYETMFVSGNQVDCYDNHSVDSVYLGFYDYGDEIYVEDVYKDNNSDFWLMGSFYDEYYNYTEFWLKFDDSLMHVE